MSLILKLKTIPLVLYIIRYYPLHGSEKLLICYKFTTKSPSRSRSAISPPAFQTINPAVIIFK